MTEPQIRDYLLGLVDVKELEKVDVATTNKVRPYWKVVDMIDEGEFIIEPRHLVNICDEVLNNKLSAETGPDGTGTIEVTQDKIEITDWDLEASKHQPANKNYKSCPIT